MTFSKIAFAIAAVGADSVGSKPNDQCTPPTPKGTNPCSGGMSCVPTTATDPKTHVQSKTGKCECVGDVSKWNTDDKRCEQKGEVKENKCGKVTFKIGEIDEHICNWSKDSNKCELDPAHKFDCNKWTPASKGATCANNGAKDDTVTCITYWPQGKCTPNSEIQDWEAKCNAINTDSEQESPIVMV